MLGAGRRPPETQPPLVIDAYAVLALAVLLQGLQIVLRRYLQVTQNSSPVKHGQLAHGYRFDVDPSLHTPSFEKALRVFAFEALNHADDSNVPRQYRQASPVIFDTAFVLASKEFIRFR